MNDIARETGHAQQQPNTWGNASHNQPATSHPAPLLGFMLVIFGGFSFREKDPTFVCELLQCTCMRKENQCIQKIRAHFLL